MCSCSGQSHEQARKVQDLLGSVGLHEIVEQGREAMAENGRALGLLNQAERADVLDFADEIAKSYRQAAERSNRRSRDQLQAVIERIDHRVQEQDWRGHVARAKEVFKERGGAQKLVDLRADLRFRFLNEDPGLSAPMAELSLSILDGVIKVGAEGDLEKVVAHMRATLEYALRGFEGKEMGRQQGGAGPFGGKGAGKGPKPIGGGAAVRGWCVALVACLVWAYSSLVAGLILCFATPFCWCCYHLAVLGTFAVHQLACFAAFLGPCNAQGGV